jgi:hypothetical protein
MPFAFVLYLALRGSGYDAMVRDELGAVVWGALLLAVAVGALPRSPINRLSWIGLGVFAAFLVWTTLGIAWSESEERTVIEVARVAIYLGVFALAVAVQGRETLRYAVFGIAAAIVVVSVIALLSRLHSEWFAVDEALVHFRTSRLSHPMGYWNGLASLMVIGIPLLLAIGADARSLSVRALATGATPLLGLTAFFTLSRGGALAGGLGLLAFILLYPRRLPALPTVLLAGTGTAILVVAANHREALVDTPLSADGLAQADGMLIITIVVAVTVALLRALYGRLEGSPRLQWPEVTRRTTARAFGAAALIAIVGFLALGGPSELSDRWDEFKEPQVLGSENLDRLQSASGNGRYQYWQASTETGNLFHGIGPGTFEFYWAREGTVGGFVRDAHSLYFETLAELGIPGLLVIMVIVTGAVGVGIWRTFYGPEPFRPWAAAATAACLTFAVSAGVDWAWEQAVLPLIFLLLAAGLLAGPPAETPADRPGAPIAVRVAVGFCALLALAVIGATLLGEGHVRASRSDAKAGDLSSALEQAESARSIEPWAATPRLQEALVLELQGRMREAAAAATEATEREPTNWRTWLVLSRLEAFRGHADASVAAFRRARDLNPRSLLFAQ